DFPDRVYKVEKALYGLHQAPRAWYKGDILLVQVYVDDIIFGSTNKKLCIAFEKLLHEKFQMSSMGELTFFLGLQVKQKKDGIFINQDKYVGEILKKFRFTEVKTASTPIETQKPLLKDEDGEEVDVHMYRSMIGSLMYLTSSRPDIMFAVCTCARYQVNPKVSHLHAVKRIFRYLKGQSKLGLWYPKDSPFDLVAYTDSDYAGASLDRKFTTGAYEVVYKELDDSLVRAATTASSLEAEHDSGNIAKTRSKATPNESSSLGTTSGVGTRRQETMGDTIAQTRFENVSKHSNDPLLARGNTLRSGKDSLKLNELMKLCTNLQTSVLDLEKTKTTQAEEIVSLKRRVKKLEQKKKSRTHRLKRLYKVGLTVRVESSGDEESLDDADMFNVNTLTGDEVLAEQEVAIKDVNLTVDEVTLAEALAALKSVKPKVKANVVEESSIPVNAVSTKVSAATTTTTAIIPTPRKGIVKTELEPKNTLKKKDKLKLDEEMALKLQAEIDEEERIARSKEEKIDEANISWDDIQEKVDADYQLTQRLQAEEQKQFTTEQKATLFKEPLE
ncbi:uncharacterized mitochondrial protein-like protein, partial [Tanacetum coccineum]